MTEVTTVPKPCTTARVLSVLGDEKTIDMFKTLTVNTKETKARLSRKQFYTRLEGLRDLGLVTKVGSKYSLTMFGIIVKNILDLGERAVISKTRLDIVDAAQKAMERTEMYVDEKEWQEFLDTTIQDPAIKKMVFSVIPANRDDQ